MAAMTFWIVIGYEPTIKLGLNSLRSPESRWLMREAILTMGTFSKTFMRSLKSSERVGFIYEGLQCRLLARVGNSQLTESAHGRLPSTVSTFPVAAILLDSVKEERHMC